MCFLLSKLRSNISPEFLILIQCPEFSFFTCATIVSLGAPRNSQFTGTRLPVEVKCIVRSPAKCGRKFAISGFYFNCYAPIGYFEIRPQQRFIWYPPPPPFVSYFFDYPNDVPYIYSYNASARKGVFLSRGGELYSYMIQVIYAWLLNSFSVLNGWVPTLLWDLTEPAAWGVGGQTRAKVVILCLLSTYLSLFIT